MECNAMCFTGKQTNKNNENKNQNIYYTTNIKDKKLKNNNKD